MNKKSKWNDLKKRTIFSLLTVSFFLIIIWFSNKLVFLPVVFLVLAFFVSVALWEYSSLIKKKYKFNYFPYLAIGGISQVFAFILASFSPFFYPAPMILFFLFALFIFGLNFVQIEGSITRVSSCLFGVLYIAVPLGMALFILLSPFSQDGRIWLLYLIVITKISDIAAFFGGKLFGKHLLAKVISPKKTVEGAIIGLICAIATSFLFYYLSKMGLCGNFYLTLSQSLFLGGLIGILGQFGDLAESLLKRDAVIKDSNCIPGVGGILDMVDSLLFTIPVVFFFLFY
jgi:phosphatidate cytidylyltransferase